MGSGEHARVLQALAEEPVRHRRHRSTKRWCGGKPGIEHTPAIRLDRYRASLRQHPDPEFGGMRECAWVNRHWHRTQPWHYRCWHQRYCTTCGKIIDRQLQPRECPDYTPRSDAGNKIPSRATSSPARIPSMAHSLRSVRAR